MGYILCEDAEESASLKAKFVAVQQLLIEKICDLSTSRYCISAEFCIERQITNRREILREERREEKEEGKQKGGKGERMDG